MAAIDLAVSVPIYDETKKESVEQTVFETRSVDSNEDGLEMVPVTMAGVWRTATDTDSLDELDERPSNEKLLATAFCSFMTFTICQTVAAYIAGSEAMMGDSAAMFVDALTYLFNLIAERRKSRFEEYWTPPPDFPTEDRQRAKRLKQRAKRKMILCLELVPPLISVIILLSVTGVVLHQSVSLLILDTHRNKSEQDDINVDLMLIFSLVNLLLDFFNVFCFARAKRLLGYRTVTQHTQGPVTYGSGPITPTSSIYAQIASHETAESEFIIDEISEELFVEPNSDSQFTIDDEPDNDGDISKVSSDADTEPTANGLHTQNSNIFDGDDDGDDDHTNNADNNNNNSTNNSTKDGNSLQRQQSFSGEQANLNMCSAYTHIFADTLRSIAVVVAATIALLADDVTSEEADATAAVVVSLLILLSLIPLFRGLIVTTGELRAITAEERSDNMFPAQVDGTNEIT